MKKYWIAVLFALGGCAYHNPLADAGMRYETLVAPPYVLSGFYRIDKRGEPLTIYVEKEQMDDEQRKAAAADTSANVAYLGRPCQYFETDICLEKQDVEIQHKAIQKGIQQLQKKAATDSVIVKGF